MAVVEPIVGHLLSQYSETVLEGFEKIKKDAVHDPQFVEHFVNHPQGLQSLQSTLCRSEFALSTLQTLNVLLKSCERLEKGEVGSSYQAGHRTRLNLLREFCRGEAFNVVKRALSTLSDQSLPLCLAALEFLSEAVLHVPRIVLARFHHTVPLHLACFRTPLPYAHRRVRAPRLQVLLHFVSSSPTTVCTHGLLTSLMEDAAELLQEGTAAGLDAGRAALRVFREAFLLSRAISSAEKRRVLLGQRHLLRLLVRALEVPAITTEAATILSHLVSELLESPADYARSRGDSLEEKGMPNYLLFLLLRQLRPKQSPAAARVVVSLLSKAPELIRPYFSRVSVHLAEDGNAPRVAPSTARIATLNLLTRLMGAPMPYYLASHCARFELVPARARTFFTLTPRDVADEICPRWVAEYVHRGINGATDGLGLVFAMQLTHAALLRAREVLHHVEAILRAEAPSFAPPVSPDDDALLFADERRTDEAGTFAAAVRANLLLALPRREEFWHRHTQQLRPWLLAGSAERGARMVGFLLPRMFLLMRLYTEVFDLREAWGGGVPVNVLPSLGRGNGDADGAFSHGWIARALREGRDWMMGWAPDAVAAMCALFTSALARGVGMPRLHHITMSHPTGGITEWPLLLSLLLWVVHHRGAGGGEGGRGRGGGRGEGGGGRGPRFPPQAPRTPPELAGNRRSRAENRGNREKGGIGAGNRAGGGVGGAFAAVGGARRDGAFRLRLRGGGDVGGGPHPAEPPGAVAHPQRPPPTRPVESRGSPRGGARSDASDLSRRDSAGRPDVSREGGRRGREIWRENRPFVGKKREIVGVVAGGPSWERGRVGGGRGCGRGAVVRSTPHRGGVPRRPSGRPQKREKRSGRVAFHARCFPRD
ncbi:unnamed protein product [Phytomonas sp. EM1]|nr:unnamed protein product [Phytomonas sp. EM1]|eukprot:CCW62495.1 unnamed protein product [Phytomonas sp. isolate EM1]